MKLPTTCIKTIQSANWRPCLIFHWPPYSQELGLFNSQRPSILDCRQSHQTSNHYWILQTRRNKGFLGKFFTFLQHIKALVQDCSIFSVLAMEILYPFIQSTAVIDVIHLNRRWFNMFNDLIHVILWASLHIGIMPSLNQPIPKLP